MKKLLKNPLRRVFCSITQILFTILQKHGKMNTESDAISETSAQADQEEVHVWNMHSKRLWIF